MKKRLAFLVFDKGQSEIDALQDDNFKRAVLILRKIAQSSYRPSKELGNTLFDSTMLNAAKQVEPWPGGVTGSLNVNGKTVYANSGIKGKTGTVVTQSIASMTFILKAVLSNPLRKMKYNSQVIYPSDIDDYFKKLKENRGYWTRDRQEVDVKLKNIELILKKVYSSNDMQQFVQAESELENIQNALKEIPIDILMILSHKNQNCVEGKLFWFNKKLKATSEIKDTLTNVAKHLVSKYTLDGIGALFERIKDRTMSSFGISINNLPEDFRADLVKEQITSILSIVLEYELSQSKFLENQGSVLTGDGEYKYMCGRCQYIEKSICLYVDHTKENNIFEGLKVYAPDGKDKLSRLSVNVFVSPGFVERRSKSGQSQKVARAQVPTPDPEPDLVPPKLTRLKRAIGTRGVPIDLTGLDVPPENAWLSGKNIIQILKS